MNPTVKKLSKVVAYDKLTQLDYCSAVSCKFTFRDVFTWIFVVFAFSSLMTYNNITLVILLMKTFLRLADTEGVIPTRLISSDWFFQLARAYMASATMAPREMEHVYRTHALLVSMGTTVTSEMFHVLILR